MKDVFVQVQHWANLKQKDYEFKDGVSDKPGEVKKMLYIGEDLVGIGQDSSARQAKIKCARNAIQNLKEGRTIRPTFAKDGK